MELCTYKVNIKGTVQGVGFRPFIYALSQRHLLCGTVSNNSKGVEIYLNADSFTFKQFLIAIEYEYPPLASIQSIAYEEITYTDFVDFKIIETQNEGAVSVNIPPDVSICSQCEDELFNPNNRRYEYPFITCTHCGVRYSIIYDLPYDRDQTSMKFFVMCESCEAEYNNPLDRRYHAQPIGCHDCGPRVQLMDNTGHCINTKDPISETASLIQAGNILAVKGVGGYHLMCDANNEIAIAKLRERKHRPTKPFAVMVNDIKMAKELAYISKEEEALLLSKERPIVILKMKTDTPKLISVNISRIGLFLPYTPLHLLLLNKVKSPLIATSANITDEPICSSLETLEKLQGVYDYVLEHNRDIVNACDDSVIMLVKNQKIMLRRARGYAPSSITLPFTLKDKILAMGANQKSTLAIGFDNQVILSPHIGDLNGISSVQYYERTIETLERIYKFEANVIAYDKHPKYESTKIAHKIQEKSASIISHEVQHHYAHILAVMAEKKMQGKVFGIAFDGTGYGDDGKLWGGEFMICDENNYERIAHIQYFKLLGGAKAIKEPRRVALSFLFSLYEEEVFSLNNATTNAFTSIELRAYYTAWKKGLNAPLTSSVGRLFDGVASLLGICQIMSFEGESGMLLQEYFDPLIEGFYPFSYSQGKIDPLPFIKEMLEEKEKHIAVSKFFHTLVEMVARVYEPYDLPMVLSGGVFQNSILLELLLQRFDHAIISNTVPPNDGAIALGQVMAAVNRLRN